MSRILIRGGTIVSDGRSFQGDILVEGETIAAVGERISKPAALDRVVDAAGLEVFPGGVDPHVHFELATPAGTSGDDFASGTRAALAGGTTTVIDFVTPGRNESLSAALADRKRAARTAVCDYGLHMSVTAWNDRTLEEAVIKVGESLVYYDGRSGEAAVTSRTAAGDTILYQVRGGDNLSRIAELFGASVDDLARLNGLSRDAVIRTGDLLRITVAGSGTARSAAPAQVQQPRPSPAPRVSTGSGKVILYEVRKGDTLWGIARLFDVSVEQLRALNNLGQQGTIAPGDTLRIVLREGP